MKETMLAENGIGLSAPQVGVNLRVIVIQLMSAGKLVGPVQEMINPVITSYSDDSMEYEEGCLSIPGEYIRINRPRSIHVKFQTLSGKYKKWFLKGLEARIVQHEIDHLDGVLMTDL
jgi:peptide deformylase